MPHATHVIMQATNQELEWARCIKQAASEDPTINEAVILDWEYLHHALVAKDQVAKAPKRLRNMQRFKERYGILLDGSLEQAARDIKLFLYSHPNLLLSVAARCDSNSVICAQYAALGVNRIQTEEAYSVLMRAMFYILQAVHHKVPTMRCGCALLLDMHGAGLPNFSLALEDRAAELYAHAYPTRVMYLVNLRMSWLFRFLFVLIRPLLSKKVRERVVHTAALEEWLAASPYPAHALPKAWGGSLSQEALADELMSLLQERYDNAANFKLPA